MPGVPASVISSLSSGDFIGIVADNPDQEITLKAFHNRVINNHKALANEVASFQPVPHRKQVSNAIIQRVYQQIEEGVQNIVETEMETILNNPVKAGLVISK